MPPNVGERGQPLGTAIDTCERPGLVVAREPGLGGEMRMAIDLLEGLNEAQRAAVVAEDGPLLIIAGPGSGKTRVLTHRIAYLVRERQVPPWQICAVTFTNKAAREMKERLERLIGGEATRLAVGTFHALCAQFLRQYGQEIGLARSFTIYDDDDQIGLIKRALKEIDLDPKQNPPRGLLSGISAAKSAGLSPDEYARQADNYRAEVIARIYRLYQAYLEQNGALDFDDLLRRALDLLCLPDGVAASRLPARFHHVLVDEYQDTNRVQFELVRRLAATHGSIYCVGDPDQSIYSWRGATIQNILDFEEVYPTARVIKLEQNYRSTKSILRAADAVIVANTQRKEKELWTENDEGMSVSVRELFDERQEAQFVVQEIQRLIERQGHSTSDVAVLYRTNVQSRPLEEACARYGLPYQLIGGTRFYERREIKDVLALLRLILNPLDDVSLRRVIDAMPIGRGLGSRTWLRLESWAATVGLSVAGALAAWLEPGAAMAPPLTGAAAAAARNLGELFARLRAGLGALDLTTLFDQAVHDSGYATALQESGEEERWENVQALRARLADYLSLPLDAQLLTFLEEAALVADVDAIDGQRDKLLLITLHAAKGLEFPVVFITGLEEGMLPHARSLDTVTGLEEERRLAYVGITRARERLYLTYARQRTSYSGVPQVSQRSSLLDSIEAASGVVGSRGRLGSGRPTSGPPSRSAPLAPTRGSTPAGRGREAWSDEGAAGQPELVAAVRIGDRVRHQRFGVGVVRAVTPTRGDIEVTVDFEGYGAKRLMASLAHLGPV